MIQDSALIETGTAPTAGASITVVAGTTAMLGTSCRIAASNVSATQGTITFDTATQASIRQVVAAGDLLIACAQFYKVAQIRAVNAGGGGVGGGANAVVIETTPVTVNDINLKPDGLVLTQGGSLYLGPGKSELSELSIAGTTATFKVGQRTGTAAKTSASVLAGATVQIDGARYGAAKVVPKDPARGLTGWVELVPLP